MNSIYPISRGESCYSEKSVSEWLSDNPGTKSGFFIGTQGFEPYLQKLESLQTGIRIVYLCNSKNFVLYTDTKIEMRD